MLFDQSLRGDSMHPPNQAFRDSMTSCIESEVPLGGLRVCKREVDDSQVFASRIDGSGASKIYLCVRPDQGIDIESQVRNIYRKLGVFLSQQNALRSDVVSEKIFFSDLEAQVESLLPIRSQFYAESGDSTPATTYLNQPSCESGVLCELQARVIFADNRDEMRVREIPGLPAPAAGKIVSYRGYDHVYVHNLTGGKSGDGFSYADQMESVFEQVQEVLEAQELTFHDVIRTWIYLRDMEKDYDDLNRVRNAYFERIGLDRIPASTGIQGGVFLVDRVGALDFYALRTQRPVTIDQMHAPTLNEAWSYGSAFARGMTVEREDRKVLYLSGTASIDTRGDVVHIGDIERQVNRMLVNVEQLLEGSGALPTDIVRATTYLKNAEDFEIFKRVFREKGFSENIPHTICHADVCRPDWLVEMEVAAIVPVQQ
jgi:enamine deaminase RidA (YjgF/YER057c/UK114 family)